MGLETIRQNYIGLFDARFGGFECGDGWSRLIDHVLFILKTAGSPARICRVKEKMGSLHVRTTDPDDLIVRQVVLAAELRSEEDCEVCGCHGRLRRKSGWVRTRCDQHADTWTLPGDRGDHDTANIHTHGSVTP